MGSPAFVGLVLEFLDARSLRQVTPLVCRVWRNVSASVHSWHATLFLGNLPPSVSAGKPPSPSEAGGLVLNAWRGLLRAFPWGRFLSAGAYKRVYAVWCASRARMEAVSVMDVMAINDTGNLDVVRQEIQTAFLLSELVRTGVCPLFVETYQVFQFSFPPPAAHWGSDAAEGGEPRPLGACPFVGGYSTGIAGGSHLFAGSEDATATDLAAVRAARVADEAALSALLAQKQQRKPTRRGIYCCITMELCSGGDCEEYVKHAPAGVPILLDSLQILFQVGGWVGGWLGGW
jgi:hypothetical protein